jgi:bifunctional non-homologous end joining protein LigD
VPDFRGAISATMLRARLSGVRPAGFPGFVEPVLATLRSKAPSAQNWCTRSSSTAVALRCTSGTPEFQFFTPRGHDWSDRFRALKGPLGQLNTHSAIIDGEVIVQTPIGASDFGALQKELGAGRSDRLVFYAFDLLHMNSFDLRNATLLDRKRVLSELLNGIEGSLEYLRIWSAHDPKRVKTS